MGGASAEVGIDGSEEDVKAESSKERGKRATLAVAFLLEKELKVTFGVNEVTFVGLSVKEVKDG